MLMMQIGIYQWREQVDNREKHEDDMFKRAAVDGRLVAFLSL